MVKKGIGQGWEVPNFRVSVFRGKRNKYCVGVPVINEGERIRKQLKRMKKYSEMVDILIFDGGSSDGSVGRSFLKKQGVLALVISERGQGRQLRAGMAWALKQGYEGVITVDGNGKDGVDAISGFVQTLDEGFDYVQGSRFVEGGKHVNTPWSRLIGIRLIISPLLSLAAGRWYTDTTNGFRAYSRQYLLHSGVKPFRSIFVNYGLLFYMVIRCNRLKLSTKEIPVTRSYPKGKVPTKVVGLKAISIVTTCLKVALGMYSP